MGPVARLPWSVTVEEHYDIVVVGSGAAGASAALRAAAHGRRVLVVTKAGIGSGSTGWAQGGLAAVLDPVQDSARDHVEDTLVAGAGLCNRAAVTALVREAPDAVRELQAMGAHFDTNSDGTLQLAREGGHRRPRIVHAGGDATGAEVQRTLDSSLTAAHIPVRERCVALDVVLDKHQRTAGVVVGTVAVDGRLTDFTLIHAAAVVVATGGLGQAYATTTNPREATGDGVALALRAGAKVADAEFVQFHPTAFWQPGGYAGQRLLVSEAVRGEGAVLVDAAGVPVMAGVHPMADLAPRDVVATAIATRLRSAPGGVVDHVYLDATSIGTRLLDRFPTIVSACREAGIDPVKDLIPVAPAAHFSCGGVVADLDGVSTVPGLFAIGEVARTGVHGANRLASNGVTEGLVAGRRLGEALGKQLPDVGSPALPDGAVSDADGAGMWIDPDGRRERSVAMSRWVGPLRDQPGLEEMQQALASVGKLSGEATLEELETTNLHTVSWLITGGAAIRQESRGCHRRLDAEALSPEWVGRIEQQLVTDENMNPAITHRFVPNTHKHEAHHEAKESGS